MLAPSLCIDNNRRHGSQVPAPGATSRPATLGMRTGTSHRSRQPGDNDWQRGKAQEGEHKGNDTRPENNHERQVGSIPASTASRSGKLRRHRCHRGTCRKNFSARASYRCRSEGILTVPEQQQPTLAGARNRSTTCYACSVGLLLRRIEAVRRNWDERICANSRGSRLADCSAMFNSHVKKRPLQTEKVAKKWQSEIHPT